MICIDYIHSTYKTNVFMDEHTSVVPRQGEIVFINNKSYRVERVEYNMYLMKTYSKDGEGLDTNMNVWVYINDSH